MRLLRSRVCHAALPFPVLPFRHAFSVYIILYYIYIYYIYYYNNIYKSQRNTFRSFKSIMKRENGTTAGRQKRNTILH